MSSQGLDDSMQDEIDDVSFVDDSYGGDDVSVSIGPGDDDDEIGENDEEDTSMLASRLKTGQDDYIVSVEKTYSNYYNNEKITMPYMTKFEKAKILGIRAEMIASGDKPMVKVNKHITNAYDIAMMELKEKKIPLIIRRSLPNGNIEDWRIEEMILKN